MMVSIILPTYNRASFIERAVRSMLEQTYTDFELIIIDDGSDDNTREIVDGIKDSRIKYFYQTNKGACVARNSGIEKARGKYIAFLDSDDIWYKSKLEKQVEVLENNPVDIVFTGYLEVTNESKTVGPIGLTEGVQNDMDKQYGIAFATVMGKSGVFKNNLYDINLPRLQDFELMYRLCKEYRFFFLNQVLYEYDNRGDNITGDPKKLLVASKYILEKHHDISDNDVLVKKISNAIFYEASILRERELKDVISLVKVALKYNTSLRSVIKGIAVILGVYRKYLRIRYNTK